MKTASHRNCTLQVTLIKFEQLQLGRKCELVFTLQTLLVFTLQTPLCSSQSRSLTSLFSAV